MNNLKKIIFFVLTLGICLSPFTLICQADGSTPSVEQEKQVTAFSAAAHLNTSADFAGIVATIINIVLGLLGMVFIVLLIIAGFNWMTAAGNEEKVEKARTTITRAIIGLLIIIAAYSITYFVFNALNNAAQNGGSGSPAQLGTSG